MYEKMEKCFNYIKNMYMKIKSKITMNGLSSESFSCNVGVHHGEILTPFLILYLEYINYLEKILDW